MRIKVIFLGMDGLIKLAKEKKANQYCIAKNSTGQKFHQAHNMPLYYRIFGEINFLPMQ